MTTASAQFGIAEFGVAEFGYSVSTTNTTTITSNTNIVYNKSLELYKKNYDVLFNTFNAKKNVLYRRYVFGEDNLSGDKNYANYNDYNIYAEVQFEGETRQVAEQGHIVESFGYIYLHAIVSKERDGTSIPSFRPQIKDEFQYDGNWYILQNITPNQLANNPMGMECLFKIISTGDNPR